MNLIQQAEQLKGVPDQMLVQMQQRPVDVPPYLVVAEMQRRQNMRKAYEGSQAQQRNAVPQPPVAQQMGQQMQQQAMQQQQAPAPMQMAEGGLASLANYFNQMGGSQLPEVNPALLGLQQFPGDPMRDEYVNIPNYGQPISMGEALAELRGVRGKSPLEDLAREYEEEEKRYREKKPGLGQILMQLGLGMAASRRPDWAGVIGEGGMGAMQGYLSERQRNQSMADRARQGKLGALEALQRSDDRLFDLANDQVRGNVATINTNKITGEEARRAYLKRIADAELRDKIEAGLASRNDADNERAIRLEQMKESRSDASEARKFAHEKELAQIRAAARGRGREREPKDESKTKISQIQALANRYDRKANQLEKQAAAIYNNNDPQKMELLRRAQESRRQADQYMDQVEGLVLGSQEKPKTDSGLGALVDALGRIPDFSRSGAGTRGMVTPSARTPLFIPPPPRR